MKNKCLSLQWGIQLAGYIWWILNTLICKTLNGIIYLKYKRQMLVDESVLEFFRNSGLWSWAGAFVVRLLYISSKYGQLEYIYTLHMCTSQTVKGSLVLVYTHSLTNQLNNEYYYLCPGEKFNDSISKLAIVRFCTHSCKMSPSSFLYTLCMISMVYTQGNFMLALAMYLWYKYFYCFTVLRLGS